MHHQQPPSAWKWQEICADAQPGSPQFELGAVKQPGSIWGDVLSPTFFSPGANGTFWHLGFQSLPYLC